MFRISDESYERVEVILEDIGYACDIEEEYQEWEDVARSSFATVMDELDSNQFDMTCSAIRERIIDEYDNGNENYAKGIGYSGETTKIVMEQTLQKKTSSGGWSEVASWSETDTGYIGSATNTKSSLSSGTYRLKTVFTVYAGSDYEVLTKYSTEKTV